MHMCMFWVSAGLEIFSLGVSLLGVYLECQGCTRFDGIVPTL